MKYAVVPTLNYLDHYWLGSLLGSLLLGSLVIAGIKPLSPHYLVWGALPRLLGALLGSLLHYMGFIRMLGREAGAGAKHLPAPVFRQ